MDLKIITGFLLCLCFLAHTSISQAAPNHSALSKLARRQAEDETAGDTTANADEDAAAATTAQPESDNSDKPTVILADGTTLVIPEGSTATIVADNEVTTVAADDNTVTASATGEADAASTGAADASEGAATGADEATTAAGEAATGADEATTAAGEASTGVDAASTDGATDGDAATDATESATGEATEATDAAEATSDATDGTANPSAATDADSSDATGATTSAGDTTEQGASEGTAATVTDDGATTDDVSGATVEQGTTDAAATTEDDGQTGTATTDGAGTDDGVTEPGVTQGPVAPGPGPSPGTAELRVVINPDRIQAQSGRTADLTCVVYGGDASTSIYWIQDEPERRYALTDPASGDDRQINGDQITLRARITLDDRSKFGKYTCMAQGASGNSAAATLDLQESSGYYPGPQPGPQPGQQPAPGPGGNRGYLRIVAPDMVDGEFVEIQCEGAAPEDESSIQWFFNGRLVTDQDPLYPRGKTLYIRPISRAYLGNYRCSVPGSGYTEGNSVLTFGGVPAPTPPPSDGGYVQPTQPISGRCGIDEATCRNGRCIPRSYLCNGNDDCGDGSDESCGPAGGSGSDACQPNEIQCSNPGRGRKCVQKFWMCDGDRDCDDGSDEEQRYCELLPRQRYCKTSEFQCAGYNGTNASPVCVPRSFQCDGYNDCPDRSDEIGCVKPTVISPPQRQIQINAGQTLTIQCTARGSPAPYINWRLNWGHICRDGYDNGRCQISQSIDASDPSLVTGTLTIRNVNNNDAGAYSCEALNNQGFIFAIPDAIVNVIIGQPQPSVSCNCNGHSSTCTPDGRCLNCQHNTAGAYCEYCASGFQGDARRGTPDACQPIPVIPTAQYCNPAGTYTERGGRCICKYNVEGDRCDQCKRNHFYLNPSSANGCLQCFCSGVSNDCTSSDWRRKSVSLPLNNWNVVPKNFATDRYEGRDAIQRRNGGRELAIDQSSLGRPANDVLYWKAPREALGDLVTLYDGSIEVHFTNDGNENDAPSNDEFIWLRGNNIDLVHKLPQTQRFKANADATYSVACNERSFTRKDGTYIDRENILMALADVDTFLVKVNPIGGRRTAVLRGVTLHPAARDGNGDTALTVEACRCPANYTGSSCEKCAEGYGRPHPLVGIYLGQCWSCRSLCNERSDRCDRDTGKCSDCQDNSDGDRCERCRAGYTLDPRLNRCVPDGGYVPGSDPTQPPYGPGPRGTYYINSQSFDGRGGSPTNIILDGNQPEQRIPVQLLGVQPRSVVWGRTDGTQLPGGVSQEGYDLVIRNPSAEQAGHYICTITHPDGHIERIPVHLEYRPGQVRPSGPNFGYAPFNSPSPNSVQPGATQLIEPQGNYNRVEWTRADGQPFPAGVYQTGNGLYINGARPEHSATYYCVLYDANGNPTTVPYEVRVEGSPYGQVAGTAPTVRIQPSVITLKEGQRMFVEYTVNSNDPDIQVVWSQVTPDGLRPIPSLFTVEQNRLFLARATSDIAGTYRVVVSNAYGRDSQDLTINVTPRRIRGQGRGQAGAPQVRFAQENYEVASGQSINIVPSVYGGSGATYTWSKDGSTNLPEGVFASGDGSLRIDGRSDQIGGRYYLDVSNAYGRVQSSPITVRWAGSYGQSGNYDADQDRSRSYVAVQFAARDEQSHQTGQDIQLQCSVQGNVDRPYEYTYTKDGRPLENNVEVHPNGLLIVRNAQAQDSGRYRCEVTFPRAPELGAQENSYDLRVDDGSAGGHGGQDGHDHHQGGYVEASADPAELTVSRGESKTISCQVKGAQSSTVKWGKYAHETTLPSYMRQQGNNVIIAPTDDTPSEQMYLQCQVDVPGQTQPVHAYASVTIRGGDESSKKKKKRRS